MVDLDSLTILDTILIMYLAGSKGKEYPERFFARDYAGNCLEFTI